MATSNALKIDRAETFSPEPRLGEIYRDAQNRSFIVLRVNRDGVFVEYADGLTRTISVTGWPLMVERTAEC